MKSYIKILFASVAIFFFSLSIKASGIEKGYIALKEYNYFEAKKIFTKSLKKDSSAAGFGLATIFFRNDNPFHALDSAYKYICISERNFIFVGDPEKIKLRQYGFDYLNIINLRQKISLQYYEFALKENSVLGFENFIQKNDWSNERFQAIYKRDSLAFESAVKINTSIELRSFMAKYPSSEFIRDAQKVLELCQYKEVTASGTMDSYISFCKDNSRNRYVKDAEDKIYELSIINKKLDEYYLFIENFPFNRNVEVAWRNVYKLFLVDYSDDRILSFQNSYPNYPFQSELQQDIKFSKRLLVPFKEGLLYGFMDYEGTPIIQPEYDYVGFFSEGVAVVMKNGKYGFIDKGNNLIIDLLYDSAIDFEGGRAIVGLKDKFGIINRVGHIILPIDFEDLGTFSEGLIYGKKDSLFGYYDNSGFQRLEEKYSEAFSFSNGIAKVQLGRKQAFIDTYGALIVSPVFESIHFFNDSLLVFEKEGRFGICRKNGTLIDSIKYDMIGILSTDRAIVTNKGKLGYINGEGKLIIDMKFDEFPNFIEVGQYKGAYAVIRIKGKYGVIDHLGKIIIPATYLHLGKFSSLIAFTKGKGWGFLDLLNNPVISAQFDFAESFNDGFAVVEKDTLLGLINPQGIVTLPIIFNEINRIDKNRVMVGLKYLHGIYSVTGEVIVPIEYQQIRIIDKDFLILTKQDEVHYLYLPQNKIIKPNPKVGDE